MLRVWPSRTQRGGAHRNRWWDVDEGLGLLVRPLVPRLPHASAMIVSPCWQERAFESARGLRFVALVTQLQREWREMCA